MSEYVYFNGVMSLTPNLSQEVVDRINAKIPKWNFDKKGEQVDWPWEVYCDGIVGGEDEQSPRYAWDKKTKEALDDETSSLAKVIQMIREESPDIHIEGEITAEYSSCEISRSQWVMEDGMLYYSNEEGSFHLRKEVDCQTGKVKEESFDYRPSDSQIDMMSEIFKQFLRAMPEITVDSTHPELAGGVMDEYESPHDYIQESFDNFLDQTL